MSTFELFFDSFIFKEGLFKRTMISFKVFIRFDLLEERSFIFDCNERISRLPVFIKLKRSIAQ